MGRKKKRVISNIWCYYCGTDFQEEKILVQHQKAKHFKCHVCLKKLSTAAGMAIHVFQVHKETVSKVPFAIAGRDSTEIEIYGMQGIPADAIAAHHGEEYEDSVFKNAKVDVASSQVVGAVEPVSIGTQFPVGTSSFYYPSAPLSSFGWPVPPHPQAWFTAHQAISEPPSPSPSPPPPPPPPPPGVSGFAQQPQFPVQNLRFPVPSTASPELRPPLPNGSPRSPPSTPLTPVSQPLFPVVANNNMPKNDSSFAVPAIPTSVPPNPSAEIKPSVSLDMRNNSSITSNYQSPKSPVGSLGNSHSCASGPITEGPSTGPPPVILNKAPQLVINEVYLLWEDDAMSMEERRMSLKKYQVHHITSHMSSVDAATNRRISESRAAGRMEVKVEM